MECGYCGEKINPSKPYSRLRLVGTNKSEPLHQRCARQIKQIGGLSRKPNEPRYIITSVK